MQVNNFKIACIIPARGGSKRIPKKNIKLLDGKPLIYYTFDLLLKNKYINDIYCSTDDIEIINCINDYPKDLNIEIIERPIELSGDTITTEETLIHAIEYIQEKYDYILLMPVTNPFRRLSDIEGIIEKVIINKADSGQTISEEKIRHGHFDGIYFKYAQDSIEIDVRKLGKKYIENSCLYLFKPDVLLKGGMLQGKKHIGFLMEEPYDLDINTIYDFIYAESIVRKIKKD